MVPQIPDSAKLPAPSGPAKALSAGVDASGARVSAPATDFRNGISVKNASDLIEAFGKAGGTPQQINQMQAIIHDLPAAAAERGLLPVDVGDSTGKVARSYDPAELLKQVQNGSQYSFLEGVKGSVVSQMAYSKEEANKYVQMGDQEFAAFKAKVVEIRDAVQTSGMQREANGMQKGFDNLLLTEANIKSIKEAALEGRKKDLATPAKVTALSMPTNIAVADVPHDGQPQMGLPDSRPAQAVAGIVT